MASQKDKNSTLERLKLSNQKFKLLLEITRAINQNITPVELIDKFCHLIHDQLNIDKILIYHFKKDHWEILSDFGTNKEDYININIDKDLSNLHDIEITLSINNPCIRHFDFIIPIYQDNKAIAYVLIADSCEREGISPTIKHLHFIQTVSNFIIQAIENRRLLEENIIQERMKREMEMASQMQKMLVPSSAIFNNNKFIKVAAFYLPHFEVGGDYYDFDYLNDDEMFFCIADVSGKGMSAAILMSNFQASIKALFTSDITLDSLVKRLNSIVLKNANGDKFITLFIARYNFKTKILNYVNAGHNAPIIYDKVLEEVNFLKTGCVGIGMLDEIPCVKTGTVKIENPTKLLCFTDGVVELEIDGIVDYGQKYVEKVIKSQNSINDTINQIISHLNIQKDNKNLFDDITLLGLDFL